MLIMNILILSWRDPKHPLAGGAEQVMHEHAKGWVEAGHNVTLFASHFKYAPRCQVLDGVTVIRYGFQYLGVHLAAFFWYLFGKHAHFDLVVDQFHGIPFFTPFYARVPKLAVLQEVAREVWLINHLPWPFSWIVGWMGYLSEPLVFIFYKHAPFMVGSESAKQDLIKLGIGDNNITVVPHGVLIRKPKPVPQKEKVKSIVFLGALAKDKGVEDAIKAFGLLTKFGKFEFWIIGRGSVSYIAKLKKLASCVGVEKSTIFWGFVSDKKKFELLARAHVMVNPSVREGWGLVNIEANAMGTPVVAYRSPGLVDSVKDGVSGVLCYHNTPEALAEAIFALLKDASYLASISKTSVAWSKQFTWVESRARSLKLIEKIAT